MIANYCISKYKSFTFGVPQGSIIGTLVSLIYSNDAATALRGPWMGGSPCRMSNLRNANVACLCR